MDHLGQLAHRFPLVARTRPPCIPLTRRVAELSARARRADQDNDLAQASVVHNQAALLASDCGLPELARRWCHRHANTYLHARPLSAQVTRHALEPLTNLARLHIREGHGERAYHLINTLYAAVSSRAEADIDGVHIPADLTDTPEAHHEVRRWLWAVLLATSSRALAVAGCWTDACARLQEYKGIGRRMLDGRQIAILAHITSGDTGAALALLNGTAPGQPWEAAVTACLIVLCRTNAQRGLDHLVAPYHGLNTAPGLAVFRTRLGLSFIDAIRAADTAHAGRIATGLIDVAIASGDGYVARDILAHDVCRDQLTTTQTGVLTDLVDDCALGRRTLPPRVLADLDTALATAEHVIARNTARPAHASCRKREPLAETTGQARPGRVSH